MLNSIENSRNLIKFNYFLVNGILTNLSKLFLNPGDIIEINEKKSWNFLYNHLINTISTLKKYYSRLFFKFNYPFVSKRKSKRYLEYKRNKLIKNDRNYIKFIGNAFNKRRTRRLPFHHYSGKKKNSTSKRPRHLYRNVIFVKKQNIKKHRKIENLLLYTKNLDNIYRSFSLYNTVNYNKFLNKKKFLNLKKNIKILNFLKKKELNNLSYSSFLNKKKIFNIKKTFLNNNLKKRLINFNKNFIKSNNKSKNNLNFFKNLYARKSYIRRKTFKIKSKFKRTLFFSSLNRYKYKDDKSFFLLKKNIKFNFSNKIFKNKILNIKYLTKNNFNTNLKKNSNFIYSKNIKKILNNNFLLKKDFIYFDKKKIISNNSNSNFFKKNLKKLNLFFKIKKYDVILKKQSINFFNKKYYLSKKSFWFKPRILKSKIKIRYNTRRRYKSPLKKKFYLKLKNFKKRINTSFYLKKINYMRSINFLKKNNSRKNNNKKLKRFLRYLKKKSIKNISNNLNYKIINDINFKKLIKINKIKNKKKLYYKKNNNLFFFNNINLIKKNKNLVNKFPKKTLIIHNNFYYKKIKQKIKFLSFFNLFFNLNNQSKKIKRFIFYKKKTNKLNNNIKLFYIWNKYVIKRKKFKQKWWSKWVYHNCFWQNKRITKNISLLVKYIKLFNNNYKNFSHYNNLKNIIWVYKDKLFIKKNKLYEKKYKKLLKNSSLKSLILLKKPKNIKNIFNCFNKNNNFNFNILNSYFKNNFNLKKSFNCFNNKKNNIIKRRFLYIKRKYLLIKGFYRKYKNYKIEFLYNDNEKKYETIQIKYKKIDLVYKQRPFNYYYAEFNLKTLEFTIIGDVDFLSFQYKTFLDFKTISYIYSE
jgi:hypothetical protein